MNDYDIKQLYEKMELDLIASMKRNLSRHLKEEKDVGFEFPQWQAEKLRELKRYQRQNAKIIGGYTKGLSKSVSEHLQSEVRQGSIRAIKQYNMVHKDKKKINELLNRSFFKTNDRKVNALIKVVNNDLEKANSAALRMINDEYRQVIHKSAFFVGNGVITEKQAIDMATKDFLSRGINCIEYSNGRRVNIASYADMAVRTASLRTHLMGEGDFRKSIGRTLVKVTTHGGACKLCTAWQGKVLVDDVYSGGKPDGKHQLLSEAMKQGFLHPNCRHGLTTYYPELEGISYDKLEEPFEIELVPDDVQEQINYYDRNAKKFHRLEIGSLDSENIKKYKETKIICETKRDNVFKINEFRNTPKYEDVTEQMLSNATPNSLRMRFDKVYIDDSGIKHPIVGKEKVHPIPRNGKEYDRAYWLKKIFGGEIHIVPRITDISNTRIKTSTPDYIWNKEKWDLKTPSNKEDSKFENAIERFVKKPKIKKQARNLIVDFEAFNDKTDEEIIELAWKTLKNPYRTDRIDTLMLVRGEDLIKIYKKV